MNSINADLQALLAAHEAATAESESRDWNYDEIKRYLTRYERQMGSFNETPDPIPNNNGSKGVGTA